VSADLAGSLVSQALAAAVLPHLDTLAAAVRADVAVSQAALSAALAEQLPGWSAPPAAAGAWRWVQVPGDARALARAAAAEGVLVTPGPAFSPQSALADRLRIAAVDPPDVLAEGVRRLARAWSTVVADHPARPARGDGRDMLLI
jgi:DNA-binding transcriptional MocR family regulator